MSNSHPRFPARAHCMLFFGLIFVPQAIAQVPTTGPSTPSYESLISEGGALLRADKLKDAYNDALAAARKDPKRFEAFALAAFILDRQGSFAKAKEILADAIARAPQDKRDVLMKFQRQINAELASSGKPTSQSVDTEARTRARQIFEQTTEQLSKDKDIAKGREGFLLAIVEDPTYALPRYNLGKLAEMEGKNAEAIRWLSDYIKLDPQGTWAGKAKDDKAFARYEWRLYQELFNYLYLRRGEIAPSRSRLP